MRIFTPTQTADALAFDRLIPALRDLFVRGCEVPARGVHQWPAATGGSAGLASTLRATLKQLCRRGVPFSITPGRRTVFNSVGSALEDLAAARLVMASA